MTKTPTEEAADRIGKITDPAMLAAIQFLNDYYDSIQPLAPKRGSREEQHAILVLSEYIRQQPELSRLQAERDRAVNVMDGLLTGDQPTRPDLALGAIRCALGVTTDGEVKPWLQTAIDFLTGSYEPLDDAEAATLPPPVKEAEPVNEVIVTPDDLQDLLIAAYEKGAHDTHEHYQPDPDPCFKEAAWDYVASLDFTATTRPHRTTPPALQARVEALEKIKDRAENLAIAHGMGWDIDGCLDELRAALTGEKEGEADGR